MRTAGMRELVLEDQRDVCGGASDPVTALLVADAYALKAALDSYDNPENPASWNVPGRVGKWLGKKLGDGYQSMKEMWNNMPATSEEVTSWRVR